MIQIFHTAVQYRSLLSPAAEDTLVQLFRHIEPSSLSPILFRRSYGSIPSSYINSFLSFIDNPHLICTDVNYACQMCLTLSLLSSDCAIHPARSAELITTLSERRIPYSSHALVCAALDETVNALSILIHGEELAPGYVRFAKPPFPLLAIEQPVNGTKTLQQSDTKIFVFRCAIYLCDLLLHLFRFCNDHFQTEQNSTNQFMNEGSIRYAVKSCIRAVHVSRSLGGSPVSPASKLERASLKILSRLASAGFPSDITSTRCTRKSILDLILQEILNDGRCSPRNCDTACRILSFLVTDWRSGDILINNRLTNTFRELLCKFGPELSEMLLMWDGDCEYTGWLLSSGHDATMSVWDEVLSRVEFWVSRGHSRYTLKWFTVLRTLLARSIQITAALSDLETTLSERDVGLTFEYWIEKVSAMLPETEVESLEEIHVICALCRGSASTTHRDIDFGISLAGILCLKHLGEHNVDDLIYVNCTDYFEDMTSQEFAAIHQRPASPSYWRGRLSPEQGLSFTDEVQKIGGSNLVFGGLGLRNGGGGKIYVQNEFRSAHGASRNTSRAPSVHVDDFYSNN